MCLNACLHVHCMHTTSIQCSCVKKCFVSYCLHSFPVPARIVSAPLHLNLKVGETLVLPCRVDGFPKPHVYWGRVLTGNQRSGSISTGRVPHGTYAPFYHIEVLNNINTSANGFYQCSVENKIVNPPEGIREIKERWMVKVTVS